MEKYNKYEKSHKLNGKYGHLLNDIPEGDNYSFFTAKMGYPNPILDGEQNFPISSISLIEINHLELSKRNRGNTQTFSLENRKLNTEELKAFNLF